MCANKVQGFHSWQGMMKRCYQKNDKAYHNYGGRGISVCQQWHSFKGFLADMGVRPDGMTLDRIDVNGNYEPSNCRWATIDTQKANMRGNKFIEVFGERMTVGQAAKKFNVQINALFSRLKTRTPEQAVMAKPRYVRKKEVCLVR